jgi:hypothetical protein
MTSHPPDQDSETPRNSFRVNQSALLHLKCLETACVEHITPEECFLSAQQQQWMAELKRMDKDLQERLTLLTEKSRALVECISKFNAKLDLVASRCLASNLGGESVNINLSESGIAFFESQALAEGQYLAIGITLLPEYQTVFTLARVIRCEPQAAHYKIAATFYRMRDSDRQRLARQVLKSQIKDRQNSLGD